LRSPTLACHQFPNKAEYAQKIAIWTYVPLGFNLLVRLLGSVHTIVAFCVFLRIGLFVFVQVSEVLGQAISRKSVTGSWQLTGKDITLHSLSRQDLNGKKAVCGRLNPVKMRYAVKIMDCDSNDGHKEQELLIHLRNIRVVKTSLQGLRVILKVCVRVYVCACVRSVCVCV